MRFSKRIKIITVVLIAIVIAGLVAWTLTSPAPLQVQSQNELKTGIFSVSKTTLAYNITDGSNAYQFEFGFDYDSNITQSSSIEYAVYGALVAEQISSPFARGVALSLQSASLLIDSHVDGSVKTSFQVKSGLATVYFQNPNTDLALGPHNMTVRLVVSPVDIGYIGNVDSSPIIVILQGAMNVTSPE